MRKTMRRGLVGALTVLVFAVAACEDGSTPPATDRPGPSAAGQIRTAAVDCPSVTTGQAALAALEPLAFPPDEEEPSGAHGEEDELNEGEPPPIADDPDAVIPDPSSLGRPVVPPSGSQGNPQPDDLIVYDDYPVSLAIGDWTLQTAEPEVAMKGDRALMTWNRMAARSLDGGRTWQYLPPATSFPRADGGFCCDQRAMHVPRQDLWLWVLQYESGPDEDNTIRLAWAAGDDAFDSARFLYADWRARDVGFEPGTFFDQPKLGVSDEHFFLSINAFADGLFVGAVVIRGRLDDLVAGSAPATTCLAAADPRSDAALFGPYPVRTAADTMYMAAHVDSSELALWSWPDDSAAPTFTAIQSHDASGQVIRFPRESPYRCPREDAGAPSDWCFRPVRDEPDRPGNDPRITTGWSTGGTVGFAWNASQGGGFSYPFVWAMVMDTGRLDACAAGECVLGYPVMFDQEYAYQYAAIAPNGSGALGAVALTGGGTEYLGCRGLARVGFSASQGWDWVEVETSSEDMPTPNSGDYLGIAADGLSSNAWSGACMTYDPLSNGNVIHFIRFGRRVDAP